MVRPSWLSTSVWAHPHATCPAPVRSFTRVGTLRPLLSPCPVNHWKTHDIKLSGCSLAVNSRGWIWTIFVQFWVLIKGVQGGLHPTPYLMGGSKICGKSAKSAYSQKKYSLLIQLIKLIIIIPLVCRTDPIQAFVQTRYRSISGQ